jgi:glyoxylase I family protein
VLRAADPAGLERFYLAVLGLSFEKRQSELAQLRAGNALIDIVPANEAAPAGGTSSTGGANLDHLCLRIEPFDAAAITNHLGRHNVACGAEALRYGAEGWPVHLLTESRRQWRRAQGTSQCRSQPLYLILPVLVTAIVRMQFEGHRNIRGRKVSLPPMGRRDYEPLDQPSPLFSSSASVSARS